MGVAAYLRHEELTYEETLNELDDDAHHGLYDATSVFLVRNPLGQAEPKGGWDLRRAEDAAARQYAAAVREMPGGIEDEDDLVVDSITNAGDGLWHAVLDFVGWNHRKQHRPAVHPTNGAIHGFYCIGSPDLERQSTGIQICVHEPHEDGGHLSHCVRDATPCELLLWRGTGNCAAYDGLHFAKQAKKHMAHHAQRQAEDEQRERDAAKAQRGTLDFWSEA